jgi:hypothetical protein
MSDEPVQTEQVAAVISSDVVSSDMNSEPIATE